MSTEVIEALEEWFMGDDAPLEKFLEEFAKEHKDVFDLTEEEHKHQYMTVYTDFQTKFEKQLEEFLKAKGYTNEDLVEAAKVEHEKDNFGMDIVGVIIATMEYDVFVSMMQDAKERFA
mmetsp:Transcript_55348/g.131456  ORF Transcript_55348/g.131456 Transcript_55348/m.131456 type:complete len:118 (-) Transcript_55348:93-446(-)